MPKFIYGLNTNFFVRRICGFAFYLLQNSKAEIYRIEPIIRNAEDLWKGFGDLEVNDLRKCFDARKKFSDEDLKLGADLWKAFQNNDFDELRKSFTKQNQNVFHISKKFAKRQSKSKIARKNLCKKLSQTAKAILEKFLKNLTKLKAFTVSAICK